MSLDFLELERDERRVLGALRCVDANTGAGIATPLLVQVAGASVLRNRSGLYVITQALDPALAAHTASFDAPPALPEPGSVPLAVTLSDPTGAHLARRATIALPRDPLPANASQSDSLFRTIDLPMYPAAIAPIGANWAVLRISVFEAASQDALSGALLIVTGNDGILARGLSDWRGEALVCVPGVPVTTWSDDPHVVVVGEIDVQVDVVFDVAAGQRTPAAQVRTGRPPAALAPVDPATIEAARAALPHATLATKLAAGRAQSLSFPLALPQEPASPLP